MPARSYRSDHTMLALLLAASCATTCSRRVASQGEQSPSSSQVLRTSSSSDASDDRLATQQKLNRFVGSVAEEWKTSSEPLERKHAPGAAQLAETLLIRCDVRSKDYLGVIGVQPLQSESFDYLTSSTTGLPDFSVTINGPLIEALLGMATSPWTHNTLARALLKSIIVKELSTLSFFSKHPYVGRSEAILSRLMTAKGVQYGGSLKAEHLVRDKDLAEIVSIFASYLARVEAVGYAEQVRYLSKRAVPGATIDSLATYPGLDPDFRGVFIEEARNMSSVDLGRDDLVWEVAVMHVQMILDQPRRAAAQLSKQHIAFNLAALLEVLEARASLIDGKIRIGVDPDTGRTPIAFMKGVRDLRVFAPRPEDLTRRFGLSLTLREDANGPETTP